MSKYTRVNLAIIPHKEITQEAITVAAKVVKNEDAYFGVDGEHYFPHITVYPPEYPKENMEKVLVVVEKFISNFEAFEVEFGEVQTHWGYIDVEIKANKTLQTFHKALVSHLNPLRQDHIREKDTHPQALAKFSQQQQNILKKYGYADAMDLYRPHLTFARLIHEQDAQRKVKSLGWTIKTMTVCTLGAFEMGDHGTCTRLLKTFKLKGS